MKRILITGGAGFIGTHLATELLAAGHSVRALDELVPQVHGPSPRRPPHLPEEVELLVGDVRDRRTVRRALEGIDVVYHLAALVGVGQSMYQVQAYTDVNAVGTAVLLETIVERPVEKLIVASSMSIYGEGLYRTPSGRVVEDGERTHEQLARGDWEPRSRSGEILQPVATPEHKMPQLASVYALGKYDQERLCLILGRAYDIPTVALRLFNVYGPHQALSNPYTGVLAIFAARLLNERPPLVFEDGQQRRDFVHVRDVARAFRLAMDRREADHRVFNVGSGQPRTIREVALEIAAALGKSDLQPVITGRHRKGDIRHCYPDLTAARQALGFEPRVRFDKGIRELAEWLEGQVAVDRVDEARAELEARGLTI